MKQVKYLTKILAAAALLLFFFSCNSGSEKKSDDAGKKNDPAVKAAQLMFIKHRVTDFAKWLPQYEAHDSVRLIYGLHDYGVSRGIDDTNMVMVTLKIDDLNRAKEFASLPDLKTAMQKSGVMGEPAIIYYDRQMLDLTTNDNPIRVIISHKVKDWDAWKKEFDSHKQARIEAGLVDRSFGYEVGNNKMVTIVDVVNDLSKARAFFASKDLADKMQAAGVDGTPTIFFYKLIKKY